MMCNQNGLACMDTTKNPKGRIIIKKRAFARTTHRFWYLQNISYYTNAPGVKGGCKNKKKKDEGQGREIDGGRERREKKQVRA